jgi:hypothetical protein
MPIKDFQVVYRLVRTKLWEQMHFELHLNFEEKDTKAGYTVPGKELVSPRVIRNFRASRILDINKQNYQENLYLYRFVLFIKFVIFED